MHEQIDTEGSGQAFTAAGAGDLSLAVKVGLTSGENNFNMAFLGVVSMPTASRDIGLESEQYSLGATVGWSPGEQQSLALYANVDLLDGHSTWTVSPSWSIALAELVGAYVEVGYQFGSAHKVRRPRPRRLGPPRPRGGAALASEWRTGLSRTGAPHRPAPGPRRTSSPVPRRGTGLRAPPDPGAGGRFFKLRHDRLDLLEKYARKLDRKLPETKVVQFIQVENKIQALLDVAAAASIPIVTETPNTLK
ncbi:MAG: hypothetical protein IPJ97_08340 [Proteobacteria bacterium]|nr:hypothetical protein [Pseudomonadota bacterium]